MLCSRKFLVAKKFMGDGCWWVITIFRQKIFVSPSSEKFRRGTRHCYTKFPVSKNFRDKEGGGNQDFPSKRFCLTLPKNFIGEHFCALFQKTSGSEKFLWIRGGLASGFSVDKFLSHSSKKLRRGSSLCFTEFLVTKKFMEKGGTTIARRIFFVSHCRKDL